MTEKIVLKEILTSISVLSEKSFMEILEIIEIDNYKKGDIFIQKNKVDKCEYIILEGICKSFLINPEGNEITLSFFKDKSVISPYTTRIKKGVSILNFRALTDLKIVKMNAHLFEKLIIENIEVRDFANSVLRNELVMKINKEIGFASLTAKERLNEFREQFIELENLIPHTDIATYLGITNVSLSRLRRELLK